MADIILQDGDGGTIIVTESVPTDINLQDNDAPSIDIDATADGRDGAPGVGVPTGGTTGQVLSKIDGTNYNTQWINAAGGVSSVNGQTGAVTLATDNVSDSGQTNKYTTAAQIAKLAGIATGATANQTDAYLLSRANHTGTQTASTISDFNSAASSAAPVQSVAGKTGTVSLVKGDVGLGNVDNTSDATKNSATVTLTNKDLTSGTNTFPTFNQNTTGSAASLTTARTIGTITGDATATGSTFNGTANNTNAITLATVNTNTGSFGSASQVGTFTVNGKGLTTAASNTSIQIAESQVTNLVSDLAAKQGTLTLTTTGTSGAATLISNTLNIPQYSGGGGASGITRSINAISASITAAATALTDYIYYWTGSTPYTLTLPTASGNTNVYTLKNTSTISQAVGNSTDITTIRPGDSYDFFSDNTTWRAF